MTAHHDEGIQAKLAEARNQIEQIEKSINDYFSQRPYVLKKSVYSPLDFEVWSYKLTRPIAPAIAVKIGFALHALRTPLDYAACIASRSYCNSDEQVSFPIGETNDKLEYSIKRQKNKLPQEFIDVVRKINPTKDGYPAIWNLHNLNINDKHKKLIPLLTSATGYQNTHISTRGWRTLNCWTPIRPSSCT